jgi:twinkle protein
MAKRQDSSTPKVFSHHESCPKCGGSDCLAVYTNGHHSCFGMGCDYFKWPESAEPNTTSTTRKPKMAGDLILDAEVQALPKRGLSEETCAKWGYKVGKKDGKTVQIANYINDGQITAQKLRFADKTFAVVGEGKRMGLFGQHLWRDSGKKVVITEGEIDAMSVSQVQNHKWPVVSVPNGAQGAKKALQNNLEWLEEFEEIILMFDNDEPGNLALEECAPLFTPGKCKVARLPLKDANAMLTANRGNEIINAIWDAKVYRPEAVRGVMDVYEEAIEIPKPGIPWPWPSLTALTYGIQRRVAYYLGAGVSIGKTNWAKELESWLVNHQGLPVGVFMLEEPNGRTLKGIAGKFVGKAFHKPNGDYTQEELTAAIQSLEGKVYLYNHATSGTDWDSIKKAIRYMVVSLGIKDIFLDNLTVLVAHLPSSEANDEVNRIAKDIAQLLQELDFTLYGFSHLNPPSTGASHERGGRVLASQFTGSRGLMRFGQYLFGLSRNLDPELPPEERNVAIFEVIKDRDYGNVGQFEIQYNPDTDQFLEPQPFKDESEEPSKF